MRIAFIDWTVASCCLYGNKVSGSTKHREGLDCTEAMERILMHGTDDNAWDFPLCLLLNYSSATWSTSTNQKCLLLKVVTIKICMNRKAEKTEKYTGKLWSVRTQEMWRCEHVTNCCGLYIHTDTNLLEDPVTFCRTTCEPHHLVNTISHITFTNNAVTRDVKPCSSLDKNSSYNITC
jgi:hypothetical protein